LVLALLLRPLYNREGNYSGRVTRPAASFDV
jgi:hypothetical protein